MLYFLNLEKSELSEDIKGLDFDKDNLPSLRTLGILYDPNSDQYLFKVNVKEHRRTRRGLLSVVGSLYDPEGFLGGIILEGKIIYQECNKLKLDWDEPIGEKLSRRWDAWLKT